MYPGHLETESDVGPFVDNLGYPWPQGLFGYDFRSLLYLKQFALSHLVLKLNICSLPGGPLETSLALSSSLRPPAGLGVPDG